MRARKPRLLVVIDTEEDWFVDTARPVALANIAELPEVHARVFEPLGVKPTFLVTYPVATDRECAAILRDLHRTGGCEIGTHVHNWTSPPFTAEDIRNRTYHTSLPYEQERHKIDELTGILERAFGKRPVTFKGGRWGMNGRTVRILEELHYEADTSVVPVTDFSPYGGGPDYFEAPFEPYVPSEGELLVAAPAPERPGALVELPVTAGFSRPGFEGQRAVLRWIYAAARRHPALRRLHLVGILHRLGLLRRITLSPESADLHAMQQLADAALARGHDVLHLTLHSNMFGVGTSPFSRTEPERDRRMRALADVLAYLVVDRGAVPETARAFAARWHGGPRPEDGAPSRKGAGRAADSVP